MLSALLAVALAPNDPAAAVLERYRRLIQNAESLRAGVEIVEPGLPRLEVLYEAQRPYRQRMEFTFRGARYVLTQDGPEFAEVDHGQKLYDLRRFPGGWAAPAGDLSELAMIAFPAMLSPGFARDFLAPVRFERLGQAQVRGRTAAHLRGEAQGDLGTVVYEMWIDAQGAPLRLGTYALGAGPDQRSTVEVLSLEIGAALPARRFAKAIPDGFVPRGLPNPGWPLRVGSRLPAMRWTGATTGAPVDSQRLLAGRDWLILVTAPDCAPSRRGAEAWAALRDDATRAGAGFLELALGRGGSALGPWPYYVDGGAFERQVNPPGTPFLALVDREGRIEGLWLGHAPDQTEAVRKEIGELLGAD
jgi:hypothetical protein